MPALRRFPSYEDAFPPADLLGAPAFDTVPAEQQAAETVDHNHKLLSFSMPVYGFTLLDYSLRRASIAISAQLHGMFFLAESPWTNSPTDVPPPPPQMAELTCYRRNLFQITGSITLPRSMRYIMTDNGDRIPILAQELVVSATESVEGNPVKIISVPWKTPAAAVNGAAVPGPEDKAEKEPPSINLDLMANGQDMDAEFATFPIAWKRLQFRIATANNGRRKELQQHFVIRLKVVATLSTGSKIPICEAHSGPVIVRGRSPRNFQSRKDLPLSGSAATSRKNQQQAARKNSITSGKGTTRASKNAKTSESPSDMSPIFPFDSAGIPPPAAPSAESPSFADWTQISASAPRATPSFPHASLAHGGPAYPQSSPGGSRPRRVSQASTPPINLSLMEDDFKTPPKPTEAQRPLLKSRQNSVNNNVPTATAPKRASPDVSALPPAKMQKMTATSSSRPHPHRSASNTMPMLNTMVSMPNTTNAPGQPAFHQPPSSYSSSIPYSGESADLLYEYFPLSMNDWQEPVDAVYRPHVVHHTHMPPDYKFMAARSRNKRYFAAEDVC
jgi:acid phosphatase